MSLIRKISSHGHSHHKCFICGKKSSKNNRIKLIKRDSIIYAYKYYKLYINLDARCCKIHLDKDGLICSDVFPNIPTSSKKIDYFKILSIESMASCEKSVFQKFRNMDTLEEHHCIKITGWTISEFIHFSYYITSINNSNGRTKEELIALYRYWLRKGIDQSSLALMFGKETSQNQISHYLSQIRTAIYKDFVPHFLGSKKSRSFYITHNNEMVKHLYDLKDDELAIVVDATYCRIEKSSNNEFQYRSWSEQKMDLLTKPFIACCADGYIIDCYGPFQANQNDATIFDYIIKTDKDFLKLLKPKKTYVFTDRGFRDIYLKLKQDYQLAAEIPPCNQLKETSNNCKEVEETKSTNKQLTVDQTVKLRYVTKIRYIIEKQIGSLKNFKALDNIRNTQAGHILIDYRISCAMLNNLHKPCCTEGQNASLIAKRIRRKAKKKTNNLEFLLKKHLNTNLIKPIDLSEINDFAKLSIKKLKTKVFLGSFQLKQCKSYIEDLIHFGKAFYLDPKETSNTIKSKLKLENSKIICVEIPSRHKRSKKSKNQIEEQDINIYRNRYKVFVQYNPNKNKAKAIKGYVCSCKSGLKMVGCCVHVAMLIYYLSNAKYNPIKLPAQHLRSIFIDMSKTEDPNKPRYVRQKRHSQTFNDFSDVSSSSSESDFETEMNEKDERKSNTKKNKRKKKKCNEEPSNDLINELEKRIPQNGAKIMYKGKENIRVINTCTIDYFLFGFWVLAKINTDFLNDANFHHSELIKEIISCIENLNWDKAKELWINQGLGLDQPPKNNEISVFGSEYSFFISHLNDYQKHILLQKCDLKCIQNNNLIIRDDAKQIFFKMVKDKLELYSCYTGRCTQCKSKISCIIKFNNKPNFLFLQSMHANIFIKDLPKQITIDGENYRFLCATVYVENHFIGVFEIQNKMIIIDDLKKSSKELTNTDNFLKNKIISNSLYYLEKK